MTCSPDWNASFFATHWACTGIVPPSHKSPASKSRPNARFFLVTVSPAAVAVAVIVAIIPAIFLFLVFIWFLFF